MHRNVATSDDDDDDDMNEKSLGSPRLFRFIVAPGPPVSPVNEGKATSSSGASVRFGT